MSTPNLPAVPRFYGAATNITPFTYRDGLGYLDRLEALRRYIDRILIPWVEENIQAIVENAVTLQDIVMAAILEDEESTTRDVLNGILAALFIPKEGVPGVYTFVVPTSTSDGDGGGDEIIDDPFNPEEYWQVVN